MTLYLIGDYDILLYFRIAFTLSECFSFSRSLILVLRPSDGLHGPHGTYTMGKFGENVVVVLADITTLEFHCSSIVGLITIGVDFLCHSFLGYINAVSILLSV